jgi:DNA-binding transcriptional ArsR family regulator
MLKLVRSNELAAGQIATHFDITQQAVSQHLQLLKRAGLLSERREGTRRLYALRPESLEPVRNVLDDIWPDALKRLKQVVEQGKRQKKEERMTP